MLHRIEYCSKLNIVNRCGIRAERIDKMKDLSYKMNENLVQRQSGETLMVYNSVTSEIYELNSVSADIFTYLSENKPLDKLIDWIFEMYQVSQEDKKEIEEEVSELLKRFMSCEIMYIDNTEM